MKLEGDRSCQGLTWRERRWSQEQKHRLRRAMETSEENFNMTWEQRGDNKGVDEESNVALVSDNRGDVDRLQARDGEELHQVQATVGA